MAWTIGMSLHWLAVAAEVPLNRNLRQSLIAPSQQSRGGGTWPAALSPPILGATLAEPNVPKRLSAVGMRFCATPSIELRRRLSPRPSLVTPTRSENHRARTAWSSVYPPHHSDFIAKSSEM